MAQLKAGQVDRYLTKPDPETFLWLIYGPDRGLVSERAGLLAGHSGADLNDPFSTVRMDMAASGDRASLETEANTVAMFGGERLIWVTGAGNDQTLVKEVRTLLDEPPVQTRIIIEAGELKKGAALRTAIESGKGSMALPCYADDNKSISRLIDDHFSQMGQTLDLDARRILTSGLGGDRRATRQELDKLSLYAHGRENITVADVNDILGDASANSVNEVTNALLSGDLGGFDRAFSRFVAGGGDCNQLLLAAIRQFQLLDRLRAEMETEGRSAAAVVNAAKPPIFFAQKPVIEQALRIWSPSALRSANSRIGDGLLTLRKGGADGVAIARMCLLGLTVQSARARAAV